MWRSKWYNYENTQNNNLDIIYVSSLLQFGISTKESYPKKMKFLILSGRLTSQIIYIFEIEQSFLNIKVNEIGTLKHLFLDVDQIMKKPMRTFKKYVSKI